MAKSKNDRNAEICAEWDSGDDMEAIASRHKITRQRVGQILRDAGRYAPMGRPIDTAVKLNVSMRVPAVDIPAIEARLDELGVKQSDRLGDRISDLVSSLIRPDQIKQSG